MTDQHRASLEDWDFVEANFPNSICDCILELRDRIAALEADQFRGATEMVAPPAPADSLVERVVDEITGSAAAYGTADELARAAIREVAAWIDDRCTQADSKDPSHFDEPTASDAIRWLCEEADRG
jgi:hypothetical protein